MSLTEKICAFETELADLKKLLLTSESLSEQKEHDIRNQIIATQNTLTELYKHNAPMGEKYSTHSIHRTPTN